MRNESSRMDGQRSNNGHKGSKGSRLCGPDERTFHPAFTCGGEPKTHWSCD